jgi:hypothetical protein
MQGNFSSVPSLACSELQYSIYSIWGTNRYSRELEQEYLWGHAKAPRTLLALSYSQKIPVQSQ